QRFQDLILARGRPRHLGEAAALLLAGIDRPERDREPAAYAGDAARDDHVDLFTAGQQTGHGLVDSTTWLERVNQVLGSRPGVYVDERCGLQRKPEGLLDCSAEDRIAGGV